MIPDSHHAREQGLPRTGTVALIVFEPPVLLFGDPFVTRLIGGVDAVIHQRGLQLIMIAPQSMSDIDRAESYVSAGHADGAMLVSFPANHPLPSELAAHGVPLVFGGRPSEPTRFNHVDVDNVGGAARAVGHLASGGRKVIAAITGRSDVPAGQDRLHGYRQGLEAAGLPADEGLIEAGNFTRAGGGRAMRFLLTKRRGLDAVFAASDVMAAEAMKVLVEAGRRVPEDVAVVGYDDDPMALTLRPPLTSVRQPIEQMGQAMAGMIVDAINSPDRPPRKVILTTHLEVRRSSAPLPGGVTAR